MKKTALLLSAIFATAFFYVSCSSNDDNTTEETDISAIGASAAIDAANEMDVNTGLLVTTPTATSKAAETPAGICATITVTQPDEAEYPKVFTVDYGTNGCKDGDLTRKGKLKITLTGPVITTGSKMIIERIDYSISGIKLEGTIEYTNTTTVETAPQWTRKVTNGKLTSSQNNAVYTNSGTYTTKQTAGVDTPYVLADNVYEITEGSHTVTGPNGTLTLTVQESLIKKYSCLFISKGKLKIEGGILNGVIDYGNNNCDAIYTYTHANGYTYTLSM